MTQGWTPTAERLRARTVYGPLRVVLMSSQGRHSSIEPPALLTMRPAVLLLVSLIMVTTGAVDELPPGVDRGMYCETCLATAKGLKKALKEHAGERSRAKIKAEMTKACESLMYEESHLTEARTACKHLLDIHKDAFEEALLTDNQDALEANLCYIHTKACIGVKRKTFQEQKQKFEDGIIEELINKHGDRVRRTKPLVEVERESLQNLKDEL